MQRREAPRPIATPTIPRRLKCCRADAAASRLDQQCHGLGDIRRIDPVPDARPRHDRRLVPRAASRPESGLRARRVAHRSLRRSHGPNTALSRTLMISAAKEPARRAADLLGGEFGDGVERDRIAGRFFVQQLDPEPARAIGRCRRQIDDAVERHASIAAIRIGDLRQQVDLENASRDRSPRAHRSGGDRGSQHDRVIARGDERVDGIAVGDIALDGRQPIAIIGKILPRAEAASLRGRTVSPHDRAPAAPRRY